MATNFLEQVAVLNKDQLLFLMSVVAAFSGVGGALGGALISGGITYLVNRSQRRHDELKQLRDVTLQLTLEEYKLLCEQAEKQFDGRIKLIQAGSKIQPMATIPYPDMDHSLSKAIARARRFENKKQERARWLRLRERIQVVCSWLRNIWRRGVSIADSRWENVCEVVKKISDKFRPTR